MANYSLEQVWNYHSKCNTAIYWRQFVNGDLVPGLYCMDHRKWIQWLDIETADFLIQNGVSVVEEDPTKKK